MKKATKILKIVIVAAGLLVIGLIVCPHQSDLGKVNPDQLLREAKAAQKNSKAAIFRLPQDTSGFILSIEGKDTIAGREALVLRLKPEEKCLPWSQYWIDEKTKAVVAFRRWDGRNNLVRSGKR